MFDDIVTGCAGFIGSQLTDALLARGDRVLGIDSFDEYYAPDLKRRNLAAAQGYHRFRLLESRLQEAPIASHLHREVRVFHLAAQPGVRGSWGSKFGGYVDNNILATQSLLETLRGARVTGPVVYASSSSVYGEAAEGPTPEDAPTRPISPYGTTKLAGEHLARLYARAWGVRTVCLRFFTVYGPRQRPDMAFHRFITALRTGAPIEVYGDGQQLRDFTFVDDIVQGVIAASEAGEPGDLFNLGAGTPVPLRTALRYLGEAAGHRPTLRAVAAQAGDPRATWADTSWAHRRLKFRPKVSLPEGIRRQWEWQSGLAPPAPTAA